MNMFWKVVTSLSLMLSINFQVYAEDQPSNRTDDFMLGYYGNVTKGEFLQEQHEMYATKAYDTVKHYGKDWFWMQCPTELDEKTIESINDLKRQTRIFARIYFWNASGYNDKYDAAGGPDWIDLADDPEALKVMLGVFDKAIGQIYEKCGEDALYGITIGEEQPVVRQFHHPVRNMRWYYANRDEAEKKIIFVHNEVYKFVKQKYPNVRVAVSLYPGIVQDKNKELLYDDAVMDCYPGFGQDYGENVERELKEWTDNFPPGPNVYVLLKGDYGVTAGRGPRQFSIDRAKIAFDAFYNAGYRNLGFFAEDRRCSLHDYLKELAETRSPGTYLNDQENLERNILSDLEKRAPQDRSFVAIASKMPEAVISEAKSGRKALDEAKNAFDAGDLKKATELNEQSRKHYHAAINQALDAAEPLRLKIESSVELDHIAVLLGLNIKAFTELEYAMTANVGILRNGSTLLTLPIFYADLPTYLEQVEEKRLLILAGLQAKLDNVRSNITEDDFAKVEAAFQELAGAIKSWSMTDAVTHAESIVGTYSALLNPYRFRMGFYNPYPFNLGVKTGIKVSQDGKNWQPLQTRLIEMPSRGEAYAELEIGLDMRPRYIWIEPGADGWQGDVGVTDIRVTSAGRIWRTRVKELSDDVEQAAAGDELMLDVGKGKIKKQKMGEDTFIVHAKGNKHYIIVEVFED